MKKYIYKILQGNNKCYISSLHLNPKDEKIMKISLISNNQPHSHQRLVFPRVAIIRFPVKSVHMLRNDTIIRNSAQLRWSEIKNGEVEIKIGHSIFISPTQPPHHLLYVRKIIRLFSFDVFLLVKPHAIKICMTGRMK